MIMFPVKNHVITSDYEMRTLKGVTAFHNGIDFVSRESDDVFSCAEGFVVYDMDKYDDALRWTKPEHSGGNYIICSHKISNKLYYARYLHLGYNLLKVGNPVDCGTLLGKYGDYGYSFGAHLHFDLWTDEWENINPHTIFNQVVA